MSSHNENIKEENKNELECELIEETDSDEEKEFKYEINEHVDCRDSVNKWLNGEILAVRNKEVRIHFTGWPQKYDEWIDQNSERIQKQWRINKSFKLNNRLDIKDENNHWLEAKIIELDKVKIKVHFYNYSSKFDTWIDKNSDRIAEVGTHSQAYGAAKFKKKTNKKDTKMENHQPYFSKNYENDLSKKGFIIKAMEEDGNCLFRAISDQLYGTQKFHFEIRKFCLDYIEIEKDFYKYYIVDGINSDSFERYIERKRRDGVWGDDVEIQALSEIYNRPIEIYLYSVKPMRTFHEISYNKNEAIRLSYQGKSHYNSKKNELDIGLTKEKFGKIEENSIKIANTRKEHERIFIDNKSKLSDFEKCIFLSRNDFEQQGVRDMEIALAESLKNNELLQKEIEEGAIKGSLDNYEKEISEQLIMQNIIEESRKVMDNKKEDDEIEKVLKESELLYNEQFNNNSAINKVVQEGFPYELVLQAYEIVGDNPDMMVKFITENLI